MPDSPAIPHGPIFPSSSSTLYSLWDSQEWLLAGLVVGLSTLLLVVLFLIPWLRRRRYYQIQRSALTTLCELMSSQNEQHLGNTLYQANVVIKQVASHYYGKQVLPLYGEAWQAFLYKTLPESVKQQHPDFYSLASRAMYDTQLLNDTVKTKLFSHFMLWLQVGLPRFSGFVFAKPVLSRHID